MFSLFVKTKIQKTLLLYLAKRSGLRFSRSGNIHRPTGAGGGGGGGGGGGEGGGDKVSKCS